MVPDVSTSVARVWGPHAWKFLHISAEHYPESPTIAEQQSCYQYLMSLCPMLPCPECRIHCDKYMREHESEVQLACRNNNELAEFLIRFHNAVNVRLGKPVLSIETARNMYRTAPATTNKWIRLLVIGILGILIVIAIWLIVRGIHAAKSCLSSASESSCPSPLLFSHLPPFPGRWHRPIGTTKIDARSCSGVL